MKKEIYLDNAATTKASKEVVREVGKYMSVSYGNPSSSHELGEKAREAIDSARVKIAKEINAKPHEIIFTSGGTESNNFALRCLNSKKNKLITSSIEHPSVWEVAKHLEKSKRCELTVIPVDKEGRIDLEKLEKEINSDTCLVSIMHVNNILGVVQDIEEIGKICKKKGVLFHTDAVQGFGKLNIDVKKMNIDMLSVSGHKIGAPKGVGFLYIREGIKLNPWLFGGGQERDLRSGTENTPGIMGMAKALELSKKVDKKRIEKLRDYFISELENIGGKINGSKKYRIYDNLNVSFSGFESGVLVQWLSEKGIYISAGSACDSKNKKEDRVMESIGLKKKDYTGAVRIVISQYIDKKDIDFTIKEIKKAINKLKI